MRERRREDPEMQYAAGSPWLGQIPTTWRLPRIKSILCERIEKDHGDEPLLAATQTKGVVRKDQYENRTVLAMKDLHLLKLVLVDDFVISLRSFQGGIESAHERGIISPAYTVIHAVDNGNQRYLSWLFKSKPFVTNLSLYVTGIRQGQNIDYERLGRSRIPLPPPDEQGAIDKYLTNADGLIRRQISNKRRLLLLLEEQKQAVIRTALIRGLDPSAPTKDSGIGWLGKIPVHWEIRRAKSVCSAIIDCKNRTPDAVTDGDFTVVRTTCIRAGEFDDTGSYKTDERNYLTWTARGAPRPGDVFFTREAPAGEACIVPERYDLCMGQRMMYLRPDPDQLDARFLLMNIYGPLTRNYIELATNGSTVGHLRLGQVNALPLVWCPLEEQRAIVRHVDEASDDINRVKDVTRREIALLLEYRTRLIGDVVLGRIDVRQASQSVPDGKSLLRAEVESDLGLQEDDELAEVTELEEVDF